MEKDYTTAKEALEALQRLEESNRMENRVKDNKIVFTVKDVKYRVKMPNLEEQEEINNARRAKKIKLMDDTSYLLEEEWVKKYKAKGIDIAKMKENIRKLQADIKSSLLKLAKTIGVDAVKKVEEEIGELRDKQIEKTIEITNLLSDSLESQLKIFTDSYTAYLIFEKKENDKWIKAFKNYEEFNKCEDIDLISRLFYEYDYLIYNRVNE